MYIYKILRRIKYTWGLVLFLIASFSASAQLAEEKYFTKHFDIESGISQAVITDIVQDKTGFIWLSTYDGLNRFDGYEFTVYSYEPDDTNSLSNSKIFKLFYDNNKHLWLYTENGLSIFNIEKGKTANVKELYDLRLQSLCNDRGNYIWGYGIDKKLYSIEKNKLEVEFYSIPNDLIQSNEEVLDLISTPKDVFLISKSGNIYAYNKEKKIWAKHYNLISNKEITYHTTTIANQQTIYLGSMHNDLVEFNVSTKEFSISQASTGQTTLLGINDLVYNKKQNALLISTYGQGLFYYDIAKSETYQYKQGEAPLNLAANYPLSVIIDRNNSIWIGYDGRGLDVLDPNIKKFTPIKHVSEEEIFNLQFVRRMIEDDAGTIWFATSGSGLVEYHRDSKKFIFHNNGPLTPSAETFIIELVKVNNQIWCGLNGGGIAIFDIEKNKVIKTIQANDAPNSLTGNTIWSFLFDEKRNEVWVGTEKKGMNCIDANDYSVKRYFSLDNPILQNNGIRVIEPTQSNEILVGTTKGLLKLNRRADVFERVYPSLGTELENMHSIKCIHEDKQGRFWIGTDGSGIVVLNKDYEVIRIFSTKDNLNNNVIYGILPQNENSFWVSSNKGLSNIIWDEETFSNDKEIKVYNYNAQNGLQSNEFNTSSYAKLSDGSLAFGGLDGANIFKGENILTSQTAPPIAITDFSVFNRRLNNELLTPYLKNIDLAYNQNSFSLRYSTLGVTLANRIKYRYQLIGYDDDWVEAKDRRYVSYTNLNAGSYEFRVMASNYDGLWGTDYTTLTIKITAPVYKRWWFILGLCAIIGLIIWGIFNTRTKQRKEKEAMKIQYTKEIAEVEMKALRAQINPHFLFNSLNSINNFILKNDNINARKYLVKFSQLVRNILNNSTSPYVSLKEELDTISLYIQIESMRFDNLFNYRVRIEEELNANEINIPSLLLQPYIENAIWHGLLHKEGRKNIDIRIKRKAEDLISIDIEDNGIGRKAAEELTSTENRRKSYGMQLGENRLKLMNSENQSRGEVSVIDLFNDDGSGKGTLIAITLPILKMKIKSNET